MKKYKAEAPICTIGKIRKILSDIGILLLEQHLIHDNFSSCRVTFGNNGLDKLNIGTNGVHSNTLWQVGMRSLWNVWRIIYF